MLNKPVFSLTALKSPSSTTARPLANTPSNIDQPQGVLLSPKVGGHRPDETLTSALSTSAEGVQSEGVLADEIQGKVTADHAAEVEGEVAQGGLVKTRREYVEEKADKGKQPDTVVSRCAERLGGKSVVSSIYDVCLRNLVGSTDTEGWVDFNSFRGKVLLLVNVASK